MSSQVFLSNFNFTHLIYKHNKKNVRSALCKHKVGRGIYTHHTKFYQILFFKTPNIGENLKQFIIFVSIIIDGRIRMPQFRTLFTRRGIKRGQLQFHILRTKKYKIILSYLYY